MPKEPLPVFDYHPNPLDTGSIGESDRVCIVCERARGYVNLAGPYSKDGIDLIFCPWCIADGSAAKKFDILFNYDIGFGESEWKSIPKQILDVVRYQTPSFTSFQGERWWTHCADAAMFLGHAGTKELKERWPEVIPIIWEVIQQWQWDKEYKIEFMENLHARYGPTVYVFQCRHCGDFGAHWDSH